ncbi:MAG: hypothetical protein HKN12_07305, partial [Gemmatimonadetes bacterium]|nr:hypothetical protein [Gemmatimonadota bacterium]
MAVAVLAAFALPAAGQFSDQIQQEAQELDRVRDELNKARESAKSYASKETNLLKQLNTLDSELSLKQRLLQGLERKEGRLSADLQQTRERLAAEQAELDGRRSVLQRRLRNIYK